MFSILSHVMTKIWVYVIPGGCFADPVESILSKLQIEYAIQVLMYTLASVLLNSNTRVNMTANANSIIRRRTPQWQPLCLVTLGVEA